MNWFHVVINLCLFLFLLLQLFSKLEKETKQEKEKHEKEYLEKENPHAYSGVLIYSQAFFKRNKQKFMTIQYLATSRRMPRLCHTWSRTEKSIFSLVSIRKLFTNYKCTHLFLFSIFSLRSFQLQIPFLLGQNPS